MKPSNQKLLFLLLTFSLVLNIYAQTLQKNSSVKSDSTNIALNAQIDVMREYNNKLLNTVYWALGTLVTVFTLLIGFGWFANFRVYERDKKTMKDEFGVLMQIELKNIEQALMKRENKHTESLENLVKKHANEAVQSLRDEINTYTINIQELEYQMLEFRAEKWDEQKVLRNSIRTYLEMTELSIKMKRDFFISRALDNVTRILKSGVEMDSDLVKDVHELLNKLPSQFDITAKNIRDILTVK